MNPMIESKLTELKFLASVVRELHEISVRECATARDYRPNPVTAETNAEDLKATMLMAQVSWERATAAYSRYENARMAHNGLVQELRAIFETYLEPHKVGL